MNLLSLKYLVTIEHCGSISKAAAKLFLSQPYLSRMVKELEEEFHITIFTRGKIFDMDTQLFVREGHPLLEKVGSLTLEDIYQYNFVMYASRKDIGPHSIENIYNENAMEDLLEWDRVKQIVYVYSRASLHNIVTQTDFMALGARAVMEQEKQFHFVTIPFPEGNDGKVMMEADTSLGYVYLKGRELPPLAKQFIDTLMKYYGAV